MDSKGRLPDAVSAPDHSYRTGTAGRYGFRPRLIALAIGASLMGIYLGGGPAVAQVPEPIVYSVDSTVGSKVDLWRANADGSFPRKIELSTSGCWAGTACRYRHPTLSPNGAKVIFTEQADLYRADVNGSNVQKLTNAQYGENHTICAGDCLNIRLEQYTEPAYSPDGTKVVLQREDMRGDHPEWNGIWVMNADGTGLTKILSWAYMEAAPTWSPDGQRIAFVSARTPGGVGLSGTTVWSVAADGSDPRQHTTLPWGSNNPEALHPTWSPDGSAIVFNDRSMDLWLVRLANGALERLTATAEGESYPDWSPDGSMIAFETSYQSAGRSRTRIDAINPDGSGYRTLVGSASAPNTGMTFRSAAGGGPPPPPSVTQLLVDYSPELRYDQQETFRADSASTITDNVVLDSRGRLVRRNSLRSSSGSTIASPYFKEKYADLTLPFLGFPSYGNAISATSSDYLDEEGTDAEKAVDAQRLHANPAYANEIYGRVVTSSSGAIVLQYWFWYYYNSKAIAGVGVHEGDWEMISIVLGSNYQPTQAAYAQHTGGERCDWVHVQRTLAERPIVYVAQDSHASYFSSGDHNWDAGAVFDNADGQGGPPVVPQVTSIDSTPGWIAWPGQWGSSNGGGLNSASPRGPAHGGNADKYADPLGWVNGVSGCTEGQTQAASARLSRRARGRDLRRGRRLTRPPAPHVRAYRSGSRVRIRYKFSTMPTGARNRPTELLTSVDPAGDRHPPLTIRSAVQGRTGVVSRPLGAGKGPFRVLVSAQAEKGAVSKTVKRRLR